MGGNGSYSKEFGGVPEASRTHIETEYRIDGHKVLLFGENVEHDKIIMNANSDSPTYLFASVDKKTGKMKVIAGWSPIREGCPPIKPNTQLKKTRVNAFR